MKSRIIRMGGEYTRKTFAKFLREHHGIRARAASKKKRK